MQCTNILNADLYEFGGPNSSGTLTMHESRNLTSPQRVVIPPWVLTNRAALADTKSAGFTDTRCCLPRIHLTQFDLEGSGDGSVTSPWCSRIPSGLGDGTGTSPWPVRHHYLHATMICMTHTCKCNSLYNHNMYNHNMYNHNSQIQFIYLS